MHAIRNMQQGGQAQSQNYFNASCFYFWCPTEKQNQNVLTSAHSVGENIKLTEEKKNWESQLCVMFQLLGDYSTMMQALQNSKDI